MANNLGCLCNNRKVDSIIPYEGQNQNCGAELHLECLVEGWVFNRENQMNCQICQWRPTKGEWIGQLELTETLTDMTIEILQGNLEELREQTGTATQIYRTQWEFLGAENLLATCIDLQRVLRRYTCMFCMSCF